MPQLKRAIVFAVFLLTALAGSVSLASAQQERLALVIGQSAYDGRQLATAANDAGLVAQTLTSAGFEVVQGRDLNATDLRRIVRDFLDKAQALPSDAAIMVYLSGYGLQLEGENYLLPVDARIQRDADVAIDGFRLSDLIRSLEGVPGQTRIVVADMARDYPMPSGSDPLARGLALMEPPAGFLIAFSSAPNITVGDAPGPYGHYATALAETIRQPGVPLDEVFSRIRLRTHETTKGLETPWHKANLGDTPFVFFEPEESASAPPPPVREARRIEDVPAEDAYSIAVERDTIQDYQAFLRRYPDHPLARRVSALLAARREAIVWRQTVNRDTRQAYWTYLRRYPDGPHVGDSRRRLARLAAPVAPPASFDEIVYEDLPPPLPQVERIEVMEVVTIIHDAPPPPPPPVYLLPAYEEDEEFVTIIREPPPPPILVGVLPIPAPIPVPRYARRPHMFYEPIAPITPRGPVTIPVAPPPVAAALMDPGAPRPRPGPRPVHEVPQQPGLMAPPQPIPVAVRPPAPNQGRPGAPASEERRPRLPSRPIPVTQAAPRPGAVAPSPAPAAPMPSGPRPVGPAAPAQPAAPRPAAPEAAQGGAPRVLPAAPQPTSPVPGQPPRDNGRVLPRVQPGAGEARPAAPQPVRPNVEPLRPAAPRPARPSVDEGRPALPRAPHPGVDEGRPRPAAPAAVLPRSVPQERMPRAVQPRPAPQQAPQVQPMQPRPAPQPVPQVRPGLPRAVPQPAPQAQPVLPRAAPAPSFRPSPPPQAMPQPQAPAFRPQGPRPAAPAAAPQPGNRHLPCQPGRPCFQER